MLQVQTAQGQTRSERPTYGSVVRSLGSRIGALLWALTDSGEVDAEAAYRRETTDRAIERDRIRTARRQAGLYRVV